MSAAAVPEYEVIEMQIPHLPGFMTFSQAGEILNVHSKQGMHRLIFESGEFVVDPDPDKSEVFAIGERPTYIVKVSAVKRVDDLRRTQGRWRNHRAAA